MILGGHSVSYQQLHQLVLSVLVPFLPQTLQDPGWLPKGYPHVKSSCSISHLNFIFFVLFFYLVPQPAMASMPPALGSQSPNPWTPSEVLLFCSFAQNFSPRLLIFQISISMPLPWGNPLWPWEHSRPWAGAADAVLQGSTAWCGWRSCSGVMMGQREKGACPFPGRPWRPPRRWMREVLRNGSESGRARRRWKRQKPALSTRFHQLLLGAAWLPCQQLTLQPRLWVPVTSGASRQSTRGLQTVHVTEPGPESETQWCPKQRWLWPQVTQEDDAGLAGVPISGGGQRFLLTLPHWPSPRLCNLQESSKLWPPWNPPHPCKPRH